MVPSVILVFFVASLFHDGGPYHTKTSPLICSVNQWTGFCMIWTSVMKELNLHGSNVAIICFCGFWKFMINCPLNTKFYWALPWEHTFKKTIAANNYLLKVNNRNTRTRCEICSKLIIKTPERHHWRRSGVFIVNFEHISHLALSFLLLTLNM